LAAQTWTWKEDREIEKKKKIRRKDKPDKGNEQKKPFRAPSISRWFMRLHWSMMDWATGVVWIVQHVPY